MQAAPMRSSLYISCLQRKDIDKQFIEIIQLKLSEEVKAPMDNHQWFL